MSTDTVYETHTTYETHETQKTHKSDETLYEYSVTPPSATSMRNLHRLILQRVVHLSYLHAIHIDRVKFYINCRRLLTAEEKAEDDDIEKVHVYVARNTTIDKCVVHQSQRGHAPRRMNVLSSLTLRS